MKKLWFAVFLLVGLLLLCILTSRFVRDTVQEVSGVLELALRAGEAQDAEAAARYTRQAAVLWDAKLPLLNAITHHSEGEDVCGALTELTRYTNLEDPEECAAAITEFIRVTPYPFG